MSIVEVLVAVFVIAIVVSSLAMAVDGGNRLRGAARLQSSLTAAGQQVQEELTSDRRWMANCTKLDVACDLKGDISAGSLDMPDVGGVARIETAEATPEDGEIDGTGDNDKDGVTPDFYKLVLVLQPSKAVADRYGVSQDVTRRRFVTTIDRQGERQVGSLVVEACKVVNQADERMVIQGCGASGRSHVDMRGCPKDPLQGCKAAWSWIDGITKGDEDTPADRSPFLSLTRINVKPMSIQIVDANTPGAKPIDPDHYDGELAVFKNVPAGEYRMTGVPNSSGANTERWTTHELPSHHDGKTASVSIDAGIQNRALIMFRPTRVGSIDLFFRRKIRTYHLSGPQYTTQVHVKPDSQPTDSYQGGSAEEACASISDIYAEGVASAPGASRECVDVVEDGNCANVLVTGSIWHQTTLANATHVMIHELGGINSVIPKESVPDPEGFGDPVILKTFTRAVALRFCTYYAEIFEHTYYSTEDPTPPFVPIDGARHAVTYYTQVAPDYRHIDFLGKGKAEAPLPVCVTAKYGQCTTPGWAGVVPLKSGLIPGLSTDILVPPADKADADVNDHFSGPPAPLSSGAIWTKTNGEMVTPTGTYNGEQIKIVGMGECYWTSDRWGGKVEGPCDPCKPMWSKTKYYSGCSILTRTDWCRPAWETVQQFAYWNEGGPVDAPFKYSIEKVCDTIKYDPPWGCTTVVPKTGNGSTCKPQPTGGGGDEKIGTTKHKSDKSQGKGIQGSLSMGGGSA